MRRLLISTALLAALPVAALAHHGWSSYDANTVVTVTAPILESRYQNPHGELLMEDRGKRWQVILAPVSRMEARGLPRESLAVGKTVTVVGYPSRVTPTEMRAERITVDGKTVELR
ncbi:MAG TPA: DUF6152 family protein [Vineibacter sp.]|nr:DUF6152 family protein [Vineibacter sp.]